MLSDPHLSMRLILYPPLFLQLAPRLHCGRPEGVSVRQHPAAARCAAGSGLGGLLLGGGCPLGPAPPPQAAGSSATGGGDGRRGGAPGGAGPRAAAGEEVGLLVDGAQHSIPLSSLTGRQQCKGCKGCPSSVPVWACQAVSFLKHVEVRARLMAVVSWAGASLSFYY
jgi:hypothetical protein